LDKPHLTDPYQKRITANAPNFDAEKAAMAASLRAIRHVEKVTLARRALQASGFRVITQIHRSKAINAFATMGSKGHAIGINDGLFGEIFRYCDRAFQHRSVFSGLGNAWAEPEPLPLPRHPLQRAASATSLGSVALTIEPAVRRDLERQSAVTFLAVQMALFVWLHELAHCVGGHVRLVRAQMPRARLNEMPEQLDLVSIKRPQDADAFRDVRHGLELEADRKAVSDLIQLQARSQSHHPQGRRFDLDTRIELAIFGAYLVTWMFDATADKRTADICLTHPAPLLRLRNITKALHDLPRNVSKLEENARTCLNSLDFKPYPIVPFNPRLSVPDRFAPVPEGLIQTRFE
jgi:hypothetical protein